MRKLILCWLVLAGLIIYINMVLAAAQRDTRDVRSPSQVQSELEKLQHVERSGEAAAYLRGSIDALKWQAGIAGAVAPSQVIQRDGLGVGD